MVVLVPVLRVVMWYVLGASETAMTKHFEAVADSLATGCLLAAYWNHLGASERYRKMQAHGVLFLGGAAALVVAGNALFLVKPEMFYVWGQTIANVGTVFAIDWAIRHPEGRVGRVLNWRPVVAIGVLSYSLYLWQNPFLLGGKGNVWTKFPQNLAFTAVAALFSYFAIEQPFLRVKDRLEAKRKGMLLAANSATLEPEITAQESSR